MPRPKKNPNKVTTKVKHQFKLFHFELIESNSFIISLLIDK